MNERILRLLIEQDLYKVGESDTFGNKNWEFRITRLDAHTWQLETRAKPKGEFIATNVNTQLSELIRHDIYQAHLISY